MAKPKDKVKFSNLKHVGYLALLLSFLVVGYFIGNYKSVQPSSQPDSTQAATKTFTNDQLKFKVQYPAKNKLYEQYPIYQLAIDDCFTIYGVREDYLQYMPTVGITIPWRNYNDLQGTPIGESKSYEVGKQINTYKRLEDKYINRVNWQTYQLTNNYENHVNTVLYLSPNSNYKLAISTGNGGPCVNRTDEILSSFQFTNFPY